jgi:Ca-activated chloride channel family protein
MLTVRLRFKKPDADESARFDVPLVDSGGTIDSASKDVQFAAAVAEFGMLLRHAEYMGDASWAQVLDLAEAGRGEDAKGYRAQFIELVQKARAIAETNQ